MHTTAGSIEAFKTSKEICPAGGGHPTTVLGSTGNETGNSQFPQSPRDQVSGRIYKDSRTERFRDGLIKFRKEKQVPDVGGTGWRTRQGHVLKNQAYYRLTHDNIWNDAIHAGRETWASWHGPRLRTDAPMMETMDRMDEQAAEWETRKKFVNTMRLETLDRFYNRKLTREQHELSSSWAPHHRALREVHDSFDTFGHDLAGLPEKALKKILTQSVLNKDQESIGKISIRLQQEEAWKMAYKMMEQERREDLLEDLRRRRVYNDMLTKMSGQPVRGREEGAGHAHRREVPCSQRTKELAEPKRVFAPEDITEVADYRGLIHADSQLALETLFPGFGAQEAMGLRASMTPVASPKNRPQHEREHDEETVRAKMKRASSMDFETGLDFSKRHLHKDLPVSEHRVSQAVFRFSPSHTHPCTREQTLATSAPPCPNQTELRGREDLPQGKSHDRDRKTLTERSSLRSMALAEELSASLSPVSATGKRSSAASIEFDLNHPSIESIPPLRKQYTYGVSSPIFAVTRRRSANRLAEKNIRVKPGGPDPGSVPTGRWDGLKDASRGFTNLGPMPLHADRHGPGGAVLGITRPAEEAIKHPKRSRSLFSLHVERQRKDVPPPPLGPATSGTGSTKRLPRAPRPQDDLTAMEKIGHSSATAGFQEPNITTGALCKTLDAFESEVDVTGRLGNEYKTAFCEPLRAAN